MSTDRMLALAIEQFKKTRRNFATQHYAWEDYGAREPSTQKGHEQYLEGA